MKLSKDEMLQKINAMEISEDVKITLMEDITDSFEDVSEAYKAEYEAEKAEALASIASLKAEIEYQKKRYKERFLNGEEVTPEESETGDVELKEEEIIDITEI